MPPVPCSLICLGVGDGSPCVNRHHNSYLLRMGGSALLLDCGEPVSSRLAAIGVGVDAVDRVLLSHMHADHVGGFFMLIQGFWLKHRTRELTVHLPGEGIRSVEQMLEGTMLFEELLPFSLRFKPLVAERTIQSDDVRIVPFANTHLNRLRKQFRKSRRRPFEAFSFLIVSGKKRVVYSADLGRMDDLDPLLHRPVELLICELAHIEPEILFENLRRKKIQRIAFIHLSEENWSRLPRLRRLAHRSLPNAEVFFPKDGQVIDF